MATATHLMGLGVPAEQAIRMAYQVVTLALTAGAQAAASGVLYGQGNKVVVATPASGDDSVTLPTNAEPGTEIVVVNAHASNSLDVFPPSGETIQKLSVNQGVAVATGASARFVKYNATTWIAAGAAAPSAT